MARYRCHYKTLASTTHTPALIITLNMSPSYQNSSYQHSNKDEFWVGDMGLCRCHYKTLACTTNTPALILTLPALSLHFP